MEIAERYDHKHQALSAEDPSRGLNRMARDVVKHLLRTLAAAGVNLAPGVLMSLLAAYQREAEDAVGDSHAVANINGIGFDRHAEERTIQVFTQALRAATEEFLADPLGPPSSRTGRGSGRSPRRRSEAPGRGGEGRRFGAAGLAMSRVGLAATDFYGTLLDRETYDFAPAQPALDALREAQVPLVLCSSKTRAEMEPLAVAIGVPGPLVVENGGAVVTGSSVLLMGTPREQLLAELPAVAREAGVRVRPFAEMSVGEVVALLGLPPEQAVLAMRREYDEPFVVEDPPGRDLEVDARLDRAARGRGLRATHGGRVHHLTGPADKGQAVRALVDGWPGGVQGEVLGSATPPTISRCSSP